MHFFNYYFVNAIEFEKNFKRTNKINDLYRFLFTKKVLFMNEKHIKLRWRGYIKYLKISRTP